MLRRFPRVDALTIRLVERDEHENVGGLVGLRERKHVCVRTADVSTRKCASRKRERFESENTRRGRRVRRRRAGARSIRRSARRCAVGPKRRVPCAAARPPPAPPPQTLPRTLRAATSATWLLLSACFSCKPGSTVFCFIVPLRSHRSNLERSGRIQKRGFRRSATVSAQDVEFGDFLAFLRALEALFWEVLPELKTHRDKR